jgi:hypothetical protein
MAEEPPLEEEPMTFLNIPHRHEAVERGKQEDPLIREFPSKGGPKKSGQ